MYIQTNAHFFTVLEYNQKKRQAAVLILEFICYKKLLFYKKMQRKLFLPNNETKS